jgi:cell division protein FtsB
MAAPRPFTELVCQGERFQISRVDLMGQCRKFENEPALLGRPYDVGSRVSVDTFRAFVNAIGGANLDITSQNVLDLYLLCREFLFGRLEGQVAAYLRQHGAVDFDSPEEEIQALKAKNAEQQGRIETLQGEVAAMRQEFQNMQAMTAGHDDYLRQLAERTMSLIQGQLLISSGDRHFLIVLHVGNEDKAVAVSNTKEFPKEPHDNRRFSLETPDWNRQVQWFRFGDRADSDMILPVCKPGYVWDQATKGAVFYLHPHHGKANQRFEYRPADGRIVCKQWGEAVTYVGGLPPMVGAPCDPARANAQRFEIRFQVADVAAKLKFPA